MATRIGELIDAWEKEPDIRAELEKGRQWVQDEFYKNEAPAQSNHQDDHETND